MAKAKTKTKTKSESSRKAAKAETKTEAAPMTTTDFVSRNAVPLGMVAAGIGILAARSLNGGDNAVATAASRGRKRLESMTEAGRDKARKGGAKLRKKSLKGVARSKRAVAAHPVAAGVAAAAVGAGLAVAVPKLIERGRS